MEMPEETDPLTDEELAELPVFPLPGVVFFPGSTLPLHLFEARYREMMERCVSEGPMAMAVTLLCDGWESDYEGHPPIHAIAGAGRILDWRRRSDGRFDLLLHGLSRVRLKELPRDRESYRCASAVKLVDRISHEQPAEDLRHLVLSIASNVVALVRERHPNFSLGVDGETPAGLLADRITDRLIPEPKRRQEILEALDVKRRLALVQDGLFELLSHLRSETPGGLLH